MKKDKNGLYRTKIVIGHDADGKPVVKWISGKTKKELEIARQQATAKYITGEAKGGDMLFGVYAMEWYKNRKVPFVREISLVPYRWIFNMYLLPALGNRQLKSVTPIDCQQVVNSMTGMSKGSINLAKQCIKDVFKSAVQDRLITYNPAADLISPPAGEKKERRALTIDECRRVEQTIERHPRGMLLAVLYYTGMRPGEALGLKWGDIDFDKGTIHIQRDIGFLKGVPHEDALKNRSSDRCVAMPSALRECLLKNRSLPHLYLFSPGGNRPASRFYLSSWWAELMLDAGMAEPIENPIRSSIVRSWRPIITPHFMRHNYISMMHANGVDPYTTARLVGHASIQTTMNIYTHLTEQEEAQMSDIVDDVFSKSCRKVAVSKSKK